MKLYIVALIAIVLFVPLSVHAVTILNEDAERSIRENCRDAQQSMQALQRADAVTRINRGNNYATMQKLMSAMSARAAANAYSVAGLAEVTREFTERRDSFISDYTEYEIALRAVVGMNCEEDTLLFYDRLESVRAQRSDLEETIKQMDKLAGDYEAAVDELRTAIGERSSE